MLVATEVAHAKAETAVGFRTATRDLTAAVQPGAPLYGIEVIGRGRLAFFGGGIPLAGEDGRVVGAIGVSGGSVEQDEDVAAAGAAAF